MNDSSTKSTKNQSTEDTEQTESLADVGHTAADFVPTGARRMKNIMMASGGSAVVMRYAAAKDVMRKLVAMEKIFAK